MKRYTKKQVGEWVVVASQASNAANPLQLANAMEVLLEGDRWREYIDPVDLQPHRWQDFHHFVEERLGTNIEALIQALRNFPRVAALVADAAIGPQGQRLSPHVVNPPNRRLAEGDTRAGGMRRLMKNRPDLAERVDRGEMTVYAALVEAGFRQSRRAVPMDLPSFALFGVRHFGREELLAAVRDAHEETRRCVIDGVEFVPRSHHQLICGNPECKRELARRREATRKAKRADSQ